MAGLSASVLARPGMTYEWRLSGGAITSAGGAAGIAAGPSNVVVYTSGASGAISISCAERDGQGTSATAAVTVVISRPAPGSGFLSVVAHPDDDILFVNPDAEKALAGGDRVRTVYLTSGDAGKPPSYWQSREEGVKNAYSTMAGVTNRWTCRSGKYAGKLVTRCQLDEQPLVSLLFLRLRDAHLAPLWARGNGVPFWLELWSGNYVAPETRQSTVDEANSYTRRELLQVLSAILEDFAPREVATLDHSRAYGNDHSDHIAAGMFALEATHAYDRADSIRGYRGYSMFQNWAAKPAPAPRNLTLAEHDHKVSLMLAYGDRVPAGGMYDEWCWRHHFFSRAPLSSGRLEGIREKCLEVSGGLAADRSRIAAARCAPGPSQTWSSRVNGEIQGLGGKCLTVGANESSIEISTCVGSLEQKWTLFDNGQLRGKDGGCVTMAPDESVSMGICQAEEAGDELTTASSQRWTR
jgi:LmbE family N-acetylglucosaminyl deacetylase